MPRLHQLLCPVTQQLVALVHLHHPRLMLPQLRVELVYRLRRARPHRDQRSGVVQRANGDLLLLLLDLCGEETDAAGHFVDAADLPYEGALEGVDVWVQLPSQFQRQMLSKDMMYSVHL